MGFLPIALALLGFLLLWGMVNYSTIKSKKAEAETIRADIKGLWQLKLEKVKPQNIPPKLKQEAISPENIAEGNQRLNEIKTYFDEAERSGFNELDQKISLKLRQYQTAANAYNKLIKGIPTRFVAIIAGFRPLP